MTDKQAGGERRRKIHPPVNRNPAPGRTADAQPELAWRRMDLHLHTPASVDYQLGGVSTLDILRKAEERGLDIIAFTDHNSVRGYAEMWREIEDLELLEHLRRLNPAEAARLAEFRRLLDRILVLPGFEFTATFGFHILAIFPETTSIRMMEHLLLTLGVAEDRFGSGEVGATSDVLRAYEILDEHGAIVIGAHVNSSHGVAMQGLRFGGQTKIAYTQDEHLAALEVTDLSSTSRRSTAYFFNGTKTEYPRRMHCIQGSDAHRLDRDPNRDTSLGVGDRVTEIQLRELSFAAIKELFRGAQFERTRPARAGGPAADALHAARESGPSTSIAFHERLSLARTGMQHVLRDVVAMANGGGGSIYVGVGSADRRTIPGVANSVAAVNELMTELRREVEPLPSVETSIVNYDAKSVIELTVKPGSDAPYELKGAGILVRDGAETRTANRGEIIALVRGRSAETTAPAAVSDMPRTKPELEPAKVLPTSVVLAPVATAEEPAAFDVPVSANGASSPSPAETPETPHWDPRAPRNGVEVVARHENDDGQISYDLRDLRNGAVTEHVTADTKRPIWRYAIQQRENRTVDAGHIRWKGDFGFWKVYRPHRGEKRYNLALRNGGEVRLFYGVGEDGLTDEWRNVIPPPRAVATEAEAAE